MQLSLEVTLRGHSGGITRLAWSRCGQFLAASAFTGEVRVWESAPVSCRDIATPRRRDTVLEDSWAGYSGAGEAYAVAYGPRGDFLASGNEDGTLDIWCAPVRGERPAFLQRYTSHDGCHGSVTCVAWAGDALILTGHKDGALVLWKPGGQGWEPKTFAMHADEVTNVAWLPGALQFASASIDKSVRLWDRRHGGKNVASHHGHDYGVNAIACAGANRTLASVDLAGQVLLWKPFTDPENPRLIKAHEECVSCVDFSHDGTLMATKATDGLVKLWRCSDWEVVASFPEDAKSGWGSVSFHPSNLMLASLGANETEIRLWEIQGIG